MGGNPTQERTQGEIPEISAFRYTGVSERAPLNPLNLNGLGFGRARRSLSDRLLRGVRFLVELAPRTGPEGGSLPELPSEGMSVLKFHVPLQQYRAKRRRHAEFGRRLALAATVAVALPALAVFGWKQLAPTAPSMRKAPVVQAAVSPGVTYHVKSGDSLYTIARAHRVKLKALLAANDLKISHRLKIGQALVIPRAALPAAPLVLTTSAQLAAHEATGMARPTTRQESPVRLAEAPARNSAPVAAKRPEKPQAEPARRTKRSNYVIQNGDTLTEIADRFGVRTAAIIEVNDLDFHTTLRVGRKLLIPANVEGRGKGRGFREKDERKVASRGLVGDLARAVGKRYLWPTAGRVSSYFGHRSGRMHTGLDIPNHRGAAIHASKAGTVVSAGWEGDYGKTVDISHGKGVVTRYAHCSKLMVKPGQRVKAGQTIALVGDTGRATGPHLHYEVRVNGRPVNPSKVM